MQKFGLNSVTDIFGLFSLHFTVRLWHIKLSKKISHISIYPRSKFNFFNEVMERNIRVCEDRRVRRQRIVELSRTIKHLTSVSSNVRVKVASAAENARADDVENISWRWRDKRCAIFSKFINIAKHVERAMDWMSHARRFWNMSRHSPVVSK